MSPTRRSDGTTDLSSQDIFNLGFPVAPTSMTMEMHMLGLMYGLTEKLTLSLMGNYMENEMDHSIISQTVEESLRTVG